MPRRTDIESILIIGAGPIIIGQACEFDYSGVQACKVLREEGYRVVLINSNPATIMTDPEMADTTYVEPVNWQTVQRVLERERPDALLPTMGGQTALNCAMDLVRRDILQDTGVELIGADQKAIETAEDRQRFREAMKRIGLATPGATLVRDMETARTVQARMGFPIVLRPSFTLAGSGGGVAWDSEQFTVLCQRGFDTSPVSSVLLEQSVLGWKEYEMEVVRDRRDNCIIVCSIENVDAMGVHTGDSITVAPAQTLTDKEYQRMRDASIAVLREIGVDTGGSNVQFAINPDDGEMVVIEMNPRVSRSSALASKATGFPIAKVAARLAAGYTLDELDNEITGGRIPASFEPTLDYVVTKAPRFAFEKFPQANDRLTTQMKSVGEVMAIGRTFQESLHKALCGLETGLTGLDEQISSETVAALRAARQDGAEAAGSQTAQDPRQKRLQRDLEIVRPQRLLYVADAFRSGMTLEAIHRYSRIDPWFLAQIEDLVETEQAVRAAGRDSLDEDRLRQLKRRGFSDARIATLCTMTEEAVRALRQQQGLRPVYKRVDSCAAEFEATTPYLYSCYEEECEARPGGNEKVLVLGSGPNRIGQGIEFDYCCVQAAFAVREAGYEAIMVNCNPETVSTDYDTSDRLYFEPLILENVLEIIDREQPAGVIVQYGGQTSLALARDLAAAGVRIIGTSPDSIDLAEDRQRFQQLLGTLGLAHSPGAVAGSRAEALQQARKLSFPLMVRPSYVLGGRAMEIVQDADELAAWIDTAVAVSRRAPVLLDQFLSGAIEVDVDAVCDGEQVLIGGIMQHIEQAGVHSGDSACCLPPFSLDAEICARLSSQVRHLAQGLNVLGLLNVQFAIQGRDIYVLEANPRAARTVPFVSKATGVPLARVAVHAMLGRSLRQQGVLNMPRCDYFAVKESVFPFVKFPGVDPLLGPEMKSTGEVMGLGASFGEAFAKAQEATGQALPRDGLAFISVRDEDKPAAAHIARTLDDLGFSLCATAGTARALQQAGLSCATVNKVRHGSPHIVDKLQNDEIALIINTTEGRKAIADSGSIRSTALQHRVCYTTTLAGAEALVAAIRHGAPQQVCDLQSLYRRTS